MTSTAEAFISFAIVLASVSRTSGRSSTVTLNIFCNAGTLISNGIFSFLANSSGVIPKTLLNVTGTVARYLFVSNQLDKVLLPTISVTFLLASRSVRNCFCSTPTVDTFAEMERAIACTYS